MLWLLNKFFRGGYATAPVVDEVWVVEPEVTLYRIADGIDMKFLYLEPSSKKAIQMDWSDWLGDSTIASVTWDATDDRVTLSDTSNTDTVATAYVTAPANSTGGRDALHCQIVTADSVARTESRTIIVRIERMAL